MLKGVSLLLFLSLSLSLSTDELKTVSMEGQKVSMEELKGVFTDELKLVSHNRRPEGSLSL